MFYLTTVSVLIFACSPLFDGLQSSALTIDEFFPFGQTNGDTAMDPADEAVVSVSFQDRFLFYGESYFFFGVSCVAIKMKYY